METLMETLQAEAQPLANPTAIGQLNKQIVELEATLARLEGALEKALERPRMLQKRLRELNEYAGQHKAAYGARRAELLDEVVDGDPPIPEHAAKFAALREEEAFMDRVIQRLGNHHTLMAERDALLARHAVASARAALVRKRALLSMAQRTMLIAPLVRHERTLTVEGGLSEALSKAALDAAVEADKAAQSVQDHDRRMGEILTGLSF